MTIYNENYRFITHGPKTKLQTATPMTFVRNLNYLQSLKDQMINYTRDGDFDSFDFQAENIKSAYNGFKARLEN